jgi:hypothetical protein
MTKHEESLSELRRLAHEVVERLSPTGLCSLVELFTEHYQCPAEEEHSLPRLSTTPAANA